MDVKYVKLGAKAVEYYDYEGEMLPYRPLYSWELDDAELKAIKRCNDEKTIELLIKIESGTLKAEDVIDANPTVFREMKDYNQYKDYWIVYHGIKDFQDDEFQINETYEVPKGFIEIRDKFRHVHDIAKQVMKGTKKPRKVIKEFLKTPEGKILASVHYYLHVPLVSAQWKATPLQLEFLQLAHPQLNERRKPTSDKYSSSNSVSIKSGMSIGDVYDLMGWMRGNKEDVSGHSET